MLLFACLLLLVTPSAAPQSPPAQDPPPATRTDPGTAAPPAPQPSPSDPQAADPTLRQMLLGGATGAFAGILAARLRQRRRRLDAGRRADNG
jgi:hypothetical protein